MPKRQRPEAVDSAELKSPSLTKRPRYNPPHERDFYSLPQAGPAPTCKYYLRSFEHRKPVNYYQSVLSNSNSSNTQLSAFNAADALKRNAHSYSINGLSGRCSTASTASGRIRKLDSLNNSTIVTRKRRQQALAKEEVSCRELMLWLTDLLVARALRLYSAVRNACIFYFKRIAFPRRTLKTMYWSRMVQKLSVFVTLSSV